MGMEILKWRRPEDAKNGESFEMPLHGPMLQDFAQEFPEKKEALDAVLKEIETQGIANFKVFDSSNFKEVSFSFTTLRITPDVIKRILPDAPTPGTTEVLPESDLVNDKDTEAARGNEENTAAKRQDFFIFSGFAPPPDGHAFTQADAGVDRFLRLLPRVANAMRRGEEPPLVNIYILGAPTGFGGSVTDTWIADVKEKGFDAYAKLYAEFVEKKEAGKSPDCHIVLQGVSKGAVVAEKVNKLLPNEMRDSIQCLLDTPAGGHAPGGIKAWLKGAQVVAGFTLETIARVGFDDMVKGIMARGSQFIRNLSRRTGVAQDTKEQTALKWKAAIAEILMMMKGSSLDTEKNRLFIRSAMYDPVSSTPARLLEIWNKKDKKIAAPIFERGKSLEVPFKSSHYLLYKRYRRWATILDFVAKTRTTEQ